MNIKFDKCPKISMLDAKANYEKFNNDIAHIKHLPPETEFKDWVTFTVADCLRILEDKKQDFEEYEKTITPFLKSCNGCKDEFYLTGRGFGRKDCPVKAAL